MIKKRIFYEKNAPQARFLMKQNSPQARLIKQNALQARFLTKSSWVLCPVNAVENFISRITAQNFLLLINELVN